MTDESTTPAPEDVPAEVLPDAAPLPVPSAGEVAYEPLAGGAVADIDLSDLAIVLDVPVELAVEIGRTTMTIRETLAIGPGSIIPLNRMAGEPVDLLVNGHRIARGEVVAIDEEFGLRITEVIAPDSAAKRRRPRAPAQRAARPPLADNSRASGSLRGRAAIWPLSRCHLDFVRPSSQFAPAPAPLLRAQRDVIWPPRGDDADGRPAGINRGRGSRAGNPRLRGAPLARGAARVVGVDPLLQHPADARQDLGDARLGDAQACGRSRRPGGACT